MGGEEGVHAGVRQWGGGEGERPSFFRRSHAAAAAPPQREAVVNILRAAVGLQPENHMLLEHRVAAAGTPASLHPDIAAATVAAVAAPAGGSGATA